MSDVINSIFGRAQNETPSSEGYGYGTAATETVDADTTETVEPAEDTTEAETEDAVDETTDVAEDSDSVEETEEDSAESDEAVVDEVADEESDEDADDTADAETPDEAVAEETEAAEEVPVAAETEVAEEAGTRPTAGARGSTTVADGVVSKIVIRVARKAEGVYELDEAGTSVEVDGEVATIAVTLVVEFGRAVKALAEQIRVQVVEAVEQYLGLEVASVDVHVADIHFPDAD
jgi:uncharacterized alkaline shock family protein YloU